jgi:hypothetical protein
LAQDKINIVKELKNQVSVSTDNNYQVCYGYEKDPLQQFTYAL